MLLYKRLFKRFIAIAMILGYSFVAQAQQSTSLPTSFSDKEIGPTGQTIKHLVAVIPGEKTFEIDDEKLIIRANESDKLSRTNKEV